MTDDKGAEEEIYKHSTYCHATYEFSKCLGCAFAAGRKAERERCAKIAEDHALLLNSPGEAAACREVAEMIRGGQDGE
jgi:hypothetical protein